MNLWLVWTTWISSIGRCLKMRAAITLDVYTTRPRKPSSLPRWGRSAVVAIGGMILIGAHHDAPAETIGGALAGAGMAWAICTWNTSRKIAAMRADHAAAMAKVDPIIRGSRKLAHAFTTDEPCADEIRELSKAAFLYEP